MQLSSEPYFDPTFEAPPEMRAKSGLATWGILSTIIGIAAIAVVPALGIIFGTDSPEEFSTGDLYSLLIVQVIWYSILIGIVYFMVRRSGGSWFNLGMRSPSAELGPSLPRPLINIWHATGRHISPLVLVISAGFILCYLSTVLIIQLESLVSDQLLPDQQLPDEVFNTTGVIVLQGIVVVLMAPIVEEILFRGFIFGGLRRAMPLLPAAVISGLVFSSIHGSLGLILPFAVVGVIFALVYVRTDSIYPPMAIHAIFNGLSFFTLLLFPELRN
jgi:membrane protease YdiL (CAAX protease family)